MKSIATILMPTLFFVLFLTTCTRLQTIDEPPKILESPESLLVPINTNAIFMCRGYCIKPCFIIWIINGTKINEYQRQYHEQQFGFSFSHQNPNNVTYTARLTARASLSVNNTWIQCETILSGDAIHAPVKSSHATLHVITESPIFPNPSISIQSNNNSASFLLQWSPPYLWTGFHIQHYNITVTDLNDNSLVTFDMLNATFSDALVSHIYHIDPYQGQMCTELLFSLSSITNRGESLTTFHIKGEHSALPGEFLDSSTNISVLFTASLIPLVNINIELPWPICNFQEGNYSIMITDTNGSIVTEHGPYHRYQLGPELNMAAGNVHHDVSLGLLRDQEYCLIVTLATVSYVTTSGSYYFDTNFEGDLTRQACEFDDDSHLAFKLATGISLGIFLLFPFALLVVLLTCIIPKKKMCDGKNSQNRMCQSMVHNPIYSGPEYESIHPQYESMKLVPQQKHTIGEITPGSCDQISIPSTEKPCHFDQPLNQKDSQFPSSFASCYSP